MNAIRVCFCATVVLSTTVAYAAPIQWSGNGHWYQAVLAPSGNITWNDARAAATAAGGYLATITSANENSFVYGLVGSNDAFWSVGVGGGGQGYLGPWLGGNQEQGAPEPAGGWKWVSGETWSYTNWNPGEASNSGPGESRLQFFGRSGKWNDAPNDTFTAYCETTTGYIIEFNKHTIPEPTALVLIGIGTASMLYHSRRRRPGILLRS
jgi:hypothetical protein